MDPTNPLANFFISRTPNVSYDSDTKLLPPDDIRPKLIEVERLDMQYNFKEFKKRTEEDADVSAWWVYWVFQTIFVWRFLFAENLSQDGQWLHQTFRDKVGERLYEKKISDTKAYLREVGETVEENL